MEETNSKKFKLEVPPIGARILKTVLSVAIVSFMYSLSDRNACFACIGAVYGMGNVFRGGLQSGGNRFLGTVIGGFFAIPFYWLMHLSPIDMPNWILMTLGCFCVLYASKFFHAHGAIQPGTVVFFVVLYTVVKDRYITYTIARVIDTGVGVLVSLLISLLLPSPMDQQALDQRATEAVKKAEESAE